MVVVVGTRPRKELVEPFCLTLSPCVLWPRVPTRLSACSSQGSMPLEVFEQFARGAPVPAKGPATRPRALDASEAGEADKAAGDANGAGNAGAASAKAGTETGAEAEGEAAAMTAAAAAAAAAEGSSAGGGAAFGWNPWNRACAPTVLVTTTVATRGLDFAGLTHVYAVRPSAIASKHHRHQGSRESNGGGDYDGGGGGSGAVGGPNHQADHCAAPAASSSSSLSSSSLPSASSLDPAAAAPLPARAAATAGLEAFMDAAAAYAHAAGRLGRLGNLARGTVTTLVGPDDTGGDDTGGSFSGVGGGAGHGGGVAAFAALVRSVVGPAADLRAVASVAEALALIRGHSRPSGGGGPSSTLPELRQRLEDALTLYDAPDDPPL